MSPEEMRLLSEEGKKAFKESVLNGQKFKNLIKDIENSAVNGYTGFRHRINSQDELRELNIIRDHLKENGYRCDIKSERKTSILGSDYFENYFVVNWEEK